MSAMRSDACPSPYIFDARAASLYSALSSSIEENAPYTPSSSVPTSRSTPAAIPSGRSVTSRITSVGLPRAVASSSIPPESVSNR